MVKLVKGQNDLLSQYPACINEWDFNKNHPLSPDAVVAGSSKKSLVDLLQRALLRTEHKSSCWTKLWLPLLFP